MMTTRNVGMGGVYGVLGAYASVTIVEAPNNDAAARFSMELGVRVGAHVTTLPAIPIGRLESVGEAVSAAVAGMEMDLPETPAG